MSCENATKELIEAQKDWVRVEKELDDLISSFIRTPGQPAGLPMPTTEQRERALRLMEERSVGHERYRAAVVAFLEARTRHRD